ncbi:unnamed protein product [Dibothriocephalus latus]|uniref:G-protein coupled receptors family 1 profile domain-containing protein n=1 Tax=Dibothriocephalus latus TaxID=60516 RepID=A0A3P6TRY7_DIBLA|nr:unnamed protein product [Dibothriocephalus latus]
MLKNVPCFEKGENNSAVSQVENLVEYLRKCLRIAKDHEMFAILQNELSNLEEMNKLKTHELVLLFALNAFMIAFGAFGAFCVIAVEIRKRRMRTAQNLFTLNLAVSDLTLCLFTQPFNLIRTLHWHYEWNFGEFMCKFTAFAQATNVFVATMSITAIAVDRFRVIIHPLRSKRPWHKPAFVLPLIWLIAFIMASPMLAFSSVTTSFSIQQRKLCTESSNSIPQLQHIKYAYGIFTIILQGSELVWWLDTFPWEAEAAMVTASDPQRTNVVSCNYDASDVRTSYSRDVQGAAGNTTIATSENERDQEGAGAATSDVGQHSDYSSPHSARVITLIQSFCLLCVLFSCCLNPFLYGFLNDDFRAECIGALCCRPPKQEISSSVGC